MAEDGDNPFEEGGAEAEGAKPSMVKVGIRLGMMVAVLGIGSVGGYGIGGMLSGSEPADPNAAAGGEGASGKAEESPLAPSGPDSQEEYEYHEFEPITVNLNEGQMARYLRASIVLAFKKADAEDGVSQVKKKQMELLNWLNTNLAIKTLDEVRGKNHSQVQREIQDAFNQKLWSGKRPLINHVLFKQFTVQ